MGKIELLAEIEHLIESTYKDKIEKAVKEKDDSFIMDFQDFSLDTQKYLNKEYGNMMNNNNSINKYIPVIFNRVALELGLCSKIESPFNNVYLHLSNVTPKIGIRELSSDIINGLIQVSAIVISVSSPQSIITVAHFQCNDCTNIIEVPQQSSELIMPTECPCGQKRGFTLLELESKWDDYQEVTVQEKPDEVRAGVIPRTIKMICKGRQLMDSCKPGDVVSISCALVPIQTKRKGIRIYTQCLDANYVEIMNKESYSIVLTDDDLFELDNISLNPDLENMLKNTIFPSIYAHEDEKQGMILAMFGGVDRKKSDISQRGTINILLIGDPSTAKTRMLQALSNAAPKVIYTSGMGASGVGLTAAAVQDQSGWRLEAGALVLADSGICCIDEIEKMSDEDRVKIHEALSKQTISIDKASIHTTLNARTSVIAAANPTHGRYDENEFLTDNISLPPTILSRFDLIFIIRDIPNEIKDRDMAETIFDMKTKEDMGDLISIETLKKYILYAKRIEPKITREAINKILDYYIPLRQQSLTISDTPIAIAPRQLEGLRRLTEARARMFLRGEATADDAEVAIGLMSRTLERAGYDPKTGKTDITGVDTGKPLSKDNERKTILNVLMDATEPLTLDDILDEIERRGLNIGRSDVLKTLNAGYSGAGEMGGSLYNPQPHLWAHVGNKKINKYESREYKGKNNE